MAWKNSWAAVTQAVSIGLRAGTGCARSRCRGRSSPSRARRLGVTALGGAVAVQALAQSVLEVDVEPGVAAAVAVADRRGGSRACRPRSSTRGSSSSARVRPSACSAVRRWWSAPSGCRCGPRTLLGLDACRPRRRGRGGRWGGPAGRRACRRSAAGQPGECQAQVAAAPWCASGPRADLPDITRWARCAGRLRAACSWRRGPRTDVPAAAADGDDGHGRRPTGPCSSGHHDGGDGAAHGCDPPWSSVRACRPAVRAPSPDPANSPGQRGRRRSSRSGRWSRSPACAAGRRPRRCHRTRRTGRPSRRPSPARRRANCSM